MFISIPCTHSSRFQQSTVATAATRYGCELHTYFTFNALFMPLRWARHYHIKRSLFHYGLKGINGKGLLTSAQFSRRSTVNGTPSCPAAGFVSAAGCNGVTRARYEYSSVMGELNMHVSVGFGVLVWGAQITSWWKWLWIIYCGFKDCDLIAAYNNRGLLTVNVSQSCV